MAGDPSNGMNGMFGGLLNGFDPQEMGGLLSGAAFLKASGPSMAPMSTGQRLGMAIQDSLKSYNDQYKQNQEQQMGMLDLAGKKISLSQNSTKLDFIRQLMGLDGGTGSAQTGNGTSSNGQTAIYPMLSGIPQLSSGIPQLGGSQSSGLANSDSSTPSSGGTGTAMTSGNPRLNALLGLSMMDGKLDTTYNIMKDMQTGYARDAGKYYIDPATGKQTYMMDPTKGFGLDAQGNVNVAPGFDDANAAIKGSEATATKGAESKFALLPQTYINGSGPNKGRPMGGSQFDYLFPNGGQGGGAPSNDSPQGPQVPHGMPADNAAGIQSRIAYAQSITDPAERKSFINAVLTGANNFPNAAQRKYFTDTFNNGIAGLPMQQSQQSSPGAQSSSIPQLGQANGTPLLQSPEEARSVSDAQDIAKQRQLAQVNNQESSFKDYKNELQKSVDTGYDLYRRNNMVRELMKTYQTGLPNAEARTSFASGLQNLFPGNDNVRSLAESINGGKVSSAQTLAQVLSSATLKNLQEVLAGNGRINMAEVKQMQAHAESPSSDSGTLTNIMDYQDRFYNDSRKEIGALTQAEKSGTLDPATWRSDYIQTRHNNETTRAGTPAASAPIQAPQRAIANLKLNPSLAAQFDAKYGKGASASVLGK